MAYPAYGFPSYQQNSQMQMNNPMAFYGVPQQQIQQVQQPQLLNGKIVENIDSVKLTDVPMDGNSYYFPKADGTEIYTKRWLANGSTEVAVFKRFIEDQKEEKEEQFNFNEMENNIMEKLNSIDERFAKFEKGFAATKTTSKKEV